jgi:hypothetical protein
VTDTNIPQDDDARKTDAPDRIWAWEQPGGLGSVRGWTDRQVQATEYIRADLLAAKDAEIARLRELVEVAYTEGFGSADGHFHMSEALAAISEETP